MHEFELIARFLSPLATDKSALGLRDDAALLGIPTDQQLVITKDAMVEGVHFIGTEPPALIARKLLRTNLSDLAAKGATPHLYFLALMLPKHIDEQWLADFAAGLSADQAEFNLSLAGGDTVATPGPLTLSATLLGLVPQDSALLRCNAQGGDDVYISGTIGDSMLGLRSLQANKAAENEYVVGRYLLPSPRVMLGKTLRGVASACMDVSDGLVQDAGHMASASKIQIIIDASAIPLSHEAQKALDAGEFSVQELLSGGDDYELLFAAPQHKKQEVLEAATLSGTQVTKIGQMCAGSGVIVLDGHGQKMMFDRTGYKHF